LRYFGLEKWQVFLELIGTAIFFYLLNRRKNSLDFNPCMKHKAVRKAVRKFAGTELGPISHEIDRESRFPWEVIEKMRPLNYFGLQIPQKYGGADLDTISYAITIEELFRNFPMTIPVVEKSCAYPCPKKLPADRLRLVAYERRTDRDQRLEEAKVVVCGGRGMGSKLKFKKLFELAQLLSGEVGATRPIVYAGWADDGALIGQAGKYIKPRILFSFGISGAIQHTAATTDADFIIAVNKNPNATMMKMADVAVVADANQVCSALIKGLKERIQTKSDYSE
jgi:hypothetical protein